METKTLKLVKSQNCEKIGKLGIWVKILKKDITSGIRAWFWHLMVLNRIQSNKSSSLEFEFEGAWLVEEELGKKGYLGLKLWIMRENTTIRIKWSIYNI